MDFTGGGNRPRAALAAAASVASSSASAMDNCNFNIENNKQMEDAVAVIDEANPSTNENNKTSQYNNQPLVDLQQSMAGLR